MLLYHSPPLPVNLHLLRPIRPNSPIRPTAQAPLLARVSDNLVGLNDGMVGKTREATRFGEEPSGQPTEGNRSRVRPEQIDVAPRQFYLISHRVSAMRNSEISQTNQVISTSAFSPRSTSRLTLT